MSASEGEIALLIDGDNASPQHFAKIVEYIAKQLGEMCIRRLYGNSQTVINSGWNAHITNYALKPEYVPNTSAGKNAADLELAMDAVELALKKEPFISSFVIVSSDGDFTGLVRRLRSTGRHVYVFGKATAPESLRKACHQFVDVDQLVEPAASSITISAPVTNIPTNASAMPAEGAEIRLMSALLRLWEDRSEDHHLPLPMKEVREMVSQIEPELALPDAKMPEWIASFRVIAEKYPYALQIDEKSGKGLVVHEMRWLVHPHLMQFVIAYRRAQIERLDDRDGWVLLSVIGDALSKNGHDTRTYIRRYPSPLKAIEAARADHPNLIEIATVATVQPRVRVRV